MSNTITNKFVFAFPINMVSPLLPCALVFLMFVWMLVVQNYYNEDIAAG